MIFIKGLPIVIRHKNRGLQSFQQCHVTDIGVVIMDKHAGIHITVCIDMEIPPAPGNTKGVEIYDELPVLLRNIVSGIVFLIIQVNQRERFF